MKKIVIASILAAGLFGTAVASGQGYGQGPMISQSAISTAGATVSSASVVNSPNQQSAHGAFAAAQNQVTLNGSSGSNRNSGYAATNAATQGTTFTAAGGMGAGGAYAGAGQTGSGSITVTTGGNHNDHGQPAVQESRPSHQSSYATATSTVFTDTGSSATVNNSGLAISGSKGMAENTSAAGYNGSTTQAVSFGGEKTKTWGFATRGDSVMAGGESGQSGSSFAQGVIGGNHHDRAE